MRVRPLEGMLYWLLRALKAVDRRPADLEHFDPEGVRSILLVSSTAIGDTLLSTPAFRAVREWYPRARIVALLNRDNQALFATNPHLDGIVPYWGGYRKFFRTLRALRRHRFDLALILHGNEPQATPLAYLAGARVILKLPNTSEYRFLLANREPVLTWDDFTHGVDQRLRVAELAGCIIRDRRMELPLAPGAVAAAEGFLRHSGIADETLVIGFQPGASTVSRMWPAERFIELGRRLLAARPAARIVLTGSPAEAALCATIAAGIGAGAVVSAGCLTLPQVPALLQRLRLLVTGDTGIMHLAIAVGTPVLALFAVADPRRSGPYYDLERHAVIKKPRTCDPCLSKRCAYPRCMEAITVDDVFDGLCRQLEAGATGGADER